jgi:hypothetical protein
VGQHYGKFLAAVAGGRVVGARVAFQDGADRPQGDIALGVAVGVVVILEMVDIDEQQRNRKSHALGAQQFVGENLLEEAVIEQPG